MQKIFFIPAGKTLETDQLQQNQRKLENTLSTCHTVAVEQRTTTPRGQRLRSAQLHLLAPGARLVRKFGCAHAELAEIREMICSRGLDATELAERGLREPGLRLSSEGYSKALLERPASSQEDVADAMQALITLTVKLHGHRRPCREDVDEILRTMGRRKTRRPGLVLETFRLASELAASSVAILRPTAATSEEDRIFLAEAGRNESAPASVSATAAAHPLFFCHLYPDTESCAAAIEALFACGDACSAEDLLRRCQAAFPPNPALYSAVIFGRLYSGDGQGAVPWGRNEPSNWGVMYPDYYNSY